jgi:LPS-assembly protein
MPRKHLPWRLLCAAILAVIGAQPAHALKPKPNTAPAAACPVPPPAMPPSSLGEEGTDDGRVHVLSDEAESKLNTSTQFRGHVEVRRGDLHLFADELFYNQLENTLNASGNIYLKKEGGETLLTPLLHYDLDTESGRAEAARFTLDQNAARGEAKRIHFEGRDILKLDSVRYTTCPPGRDDWLLNASHLTLDKNTETGTATNAWVEFMHVPIFYTPYLSFPLGEERRSGLLGPHFGHTTRSGLVVGIPYYFNLAPNYDDTLTVEILGDRGLRALNEFRYLGGSYKGSLNLTYLPNDRKTGTDREGLFLRHDQSLSPLWILSTDIQWVSDSQYFIDLSGGGTGIAEAARTVLPRSVSLNYGGSVWRFTTRVSTFQTLDTTIPLTEQPYQRLPQLLLTADSPGGPNTLHYALESEWVNFYRQASINGQRLDLLPSVSLPLRTAYFYFTPKAGYRYTTWRLDNGIGDAAPERTLPVYSVDSGLAFERDSEWGGKIFTQTLEPRLYYVRIPYRDQDSLPVFDASVPDFSFVNFFRENRFVGADRVGDANQITAAVTSRFLAPESGAEVARISLGQVRYFDNQQVNLPSGTVTQTSSDLIGEVTARLGQPWYLRSGLQWDNKASETRKASTYLHYYPAADRIVNLGYRYVNTPPNPQQELLDASAQWPLAHRWTGLARWSFSTTDSQTILAYAGLEYASCCWALRLTGRHRILPDGTLDNTVLFEFQLSGFAKLGESEENPLKQGKFLFE